MNMKQALKILKHDYPGRTVAIRRSLWHHSFENGDSESDDYRVTIFAPSSTSDCEGFDGGTLEECLAKVAEYERGKTTKEAI